MLRNLLKRRKTEAFAAQAQTAGSGSVTGAAGPRAAVSGRHRRTGGVDWWLFAIMCMLLSIGLVMVLSASGIVAESSYGDKYYFFKRQVVYALVGGVVLWVAAVLPRSFLYKMQYPFIFFCLLLLLFAKRLDLCIFLCFDRAGGTLRQRLLHGRCDLRLLRIADIRLL